MLVGTCCCGGRQDSAGVAVGVGRVRAADVVLPWLRFLLDGEQSGSESAACRSRRRVWGEMPPLRVRERRVDVLAERHVDEVQGALGSASQGEQLLSRNRQLWPAAQ